MSSQVLLAERFRALHHREAPLVLANVWDSLSAAVVSDAGFPAIATASAAIALSGGVDDGEVVRFDELVELVSRISGAVPVPVSVDFERGYGRGPSDVRANMRRLIMAGAVGVNIEDSVDHHTLRPVEAQCERIRAIRAAGEEAGVTVFINARTDVFMIGGAADDALARVRAYVEAGADGIYPIMCEDLSTLERLHAATERPINVLVTSSLPALTSLVEVGVRRLSMGPGLLSIAAGAVSDAARRLAGGDIRLEDLPRLATSYMRRIQGIAE